MRDTRVDVLVDRLRDRRSRKVAFLSHCLANENTRYLGGACRAACVREIVEQCIDGDIGIVQMPCPEQAAWGGVLKRRLLRLYGAGPAARLAPVAVRYTQLVYRRLARQVAAQIADYVASGLTVVGIIGVDASPSCGVSTTLDLGGAARDLAALDPDTVTVDEQNALVRRQARSGHGLFIEALAAELRHRDLDVPLLAHDLLGELDGKPSPVRFGAQTLRSSTSATSPPRWSFPR